MQDLEDGWFVSAAYELFEVESEWLVKMLPTDMD